MQPPGGRLSQLSLLNYCFQGVCYVIKKLYVGNLPYNMTNGDLEGLFAQYGAVQSAQVIIDRDTGRSKGFGFVEMETDADAKKAIDALSGQEVGGRMLTVNEARPKENRSSGQGAGRRSYSESRRY
jgi:cold-inducible RNA-binding protein